MRKEDLEKGKYENTSNIEDIQRKQKQDIPQVIPEHMRSYYMTNFTSSETNRNYEPENQKVFRGKRKSSSVRWPENIHQQRRNGNSHDYNKIHTTHEKQG